MHSLLDGPAEWCSAYNWSQLICIYISFRIRLLTAIHCQRATCKSHVGPGHVERSSGQELIYVRRISTANVLFMLQLNNNFVSWYCNLFLLTAVHSSNQLATRIDWHTTCLIMFLHSTHVLYSIQRVAPLNGSPQHSICLLCTQRPEQGDNLTVQHSEALLRLAGGDSNVTNWFYWFISRL